MHSKKGVLELQFNWIFILVVGALVLILFTSILINQKRLSDTSTNIEILNNLDSILSGTEVSIGTVNSIEVTRSRIGFECDRITVGDSSRSINMLDFFSPSFLEGNKIITLIDEWSLPFRVTNTLYLTNSDMRYIFVSDSFDDTTLAKNISDMIPSDIEIEEVEIGNINSITNNNDRRVRIIFFSNNPTTPILQVPDKLKGMKDGSITALHVYGGEDKGDISFFASDNDNLKLIGDPKNHPKKYLRKSMLLGAIFSDDPDMFDCTVNNIFRKLGVVGKVYKLKIDILRNNLAGLVSECNTIYSNSLSELNLILSESESQSPDFNVVNKAAKDLDAHNKNLISKSCTSIY